MGSTSAARWLCTWPPSGRAWKFPQLKKMGLARHVALSAGRCAGSRRRGYARSSFFVRTTHGAHSLSHRVILSRSGPLWCAHQHTHTHLQPRTTFSMGGQEAGQERGRHRQASITQHTMYEHVAHKCDCGWEPTAQQAHCIPFANIVASMLPLPGLARHASPHLAAPCYAGAAPLCCAIYRTPRNPKARPARLAALTCIVCVCVLGV